MRRCSERSLFYILLLILISGCDRADRIRLGCFPLSISNRKPEIQFCEVLEQTAQSVQKGNFLFHPLEWSSGLIESDSIFNPSFYLRYARRLGLDTMVLVAQRMRSDRSVLLDVRLISVKSGETLLDTALAVESNPPAAAFLSTANRIISSVSRQRVENTSFDIPDPAAWESFADGRWYEYIGERDSAETAYRRTQQIDSLYSRSALRLAALLIDKIVVYRQEGRYTEDLAVETSRILRNDRIPFGDNAVRHRLLGALYILTEQWNKAESELKTAYRIDKDDPYVTWYLSRLHPSRIRDLGFRSKKALLRRSIGLNPGFVRAWIDLGNDYYYRLQVRKAEKTYGKLLRIQPLSLDALLALGKLYTLQNDVLNIIRIYTRVLEIDPGSAAAYYNLGVAYFNDEKEEEAVRFFRRAVEIGDHADSHFYLGIIDAKRGNIDQAIQHLRKRIRLKKGPDDPFAEQARKMLYDLLHNRQ